MWDLLQCVVVRTEGVSHVPGTWQVVALLVFLLSRGTLRTNSSFPRKDCFYLSKLAKKKKKPISVEAVKTLGDIRTEKSLP